MHGTNPVKAELPGNLGQTSLVTKLSHDLLAVVIVLEVELKVRMVQRLRVRQLGGVEVLENVAEIHPALEGYPVVLWVEHKAASAQVVRKERVRNSFRFVPTEVQT